jgi:hypothetical protein
MYDDGQSPVESTLQFGRPIDSEPLHRRSLQEPQPPQQPEPQPLDQPLPQSRPDPQLPPAVEPMALPSAPTRGDERTPIFDTMESDWFRTGGIGQMDRMQAVHVNDTPQPVNEPQSPLPSRPAHRVERPQAPAAPQWPQAAPQRARSAEPAAQWRTSSTNDEGWKRAEQVREPQSGGVTSSGLPRRVPRANLVPGTAQQAPQGGPQVSRAPDEVRGRLTNLRRGIQQGRQADGSGGSNGHGFFGPSHQER